MPLPVTPRKPKGPTAKRRAKKARARLTQYQRVCVLVDVRDGLSCRVCGVSTLWVCAEHHHIIPRSLGGQHTTENIARICFQCHRDIHDRRITVTGNANKQLRIVRAA